MYIKFVEKINPDLNKSPVLYIHCDEDEFEEFLNKYLIDLYEWQKTVDFKGFPLGRLEAPTVICDFMHKLTAYYLESSGDRVKEQSRIISWMRLLDSSYFEGGGFEEVQIIELQEPVK